MDFETMARSLMKGGNAAALQGLTQTPEAQRLSAQIDGAQLESAVRAGDENALRGILQSVLATPEGKRLASQVLGTVDGHGR